MATRYGGVLYLRSERERERGRRDGRARRAHEKRKLCFKFSKVHPRSFRDWPTISVRRCLLSLSSSSLAKTMMGSAPPGNRKQKRKRRIDENYYHKVASRMAAFWLREEDRSSRGRVLHLAASHPGLPVPSHPNIPRMRSRWDPDAVSRSSSS